MLQRVLPGSGPEGFPDITGGPPRTLPDWIRYFSHGDEGAQRLSGLLRTLAKQGYEQVQRKRLHGHFALTSPPITPDQLDKFLYRRRLGGEARALIVRYLWDEGLLPHEPQPTAPGDLLNQLHRSLAGFWGIPEESLAWSEARLAGRYWIYRASAHEPGRYVRGLLTVHARAQPGEAMRVSEDYRVPGDAAAGEHGLHRRYEGPVLEKCHRPILLSCLWLPAWSGPELACMRFILIAQTLAHADGKIVSMCGWTASSHCPGRFLTSAICLERIPEGFPRQPEEELRTLAASEVPAAVLNRLTCALDMDGLM
jgi:hypothetical protein